MNVNTEGSNYCTGNTQEKKGQIRKDLKKYILQTDETYMMNLQMKEKNLACDPKFTC